MYMYATHILSFSGVLRAATRLILLLSTSSHVGLYTIYLHVRRFIHSLVYMMHLDFIMTLFVGVWHGPEGTEDTTQSKESTIANADYNS